MKKLGLMTVAEAAEYINVPRPTLYQHLREGHIPGIQIGGRWRIEQDKLNDFIGRAKRGGVESSDPIMDQYGFPVNSQSFVQKNRYSPDRLDDEMSDRLTVLRAENTRLRELAADQLLDLERLRSLRNTLA